MMVDWTLVGAALLGAFGLAGIAYAKGQQDERERRPKASSSTSKQAEQAKRDGRRDSEVGSGTVVGGYRLESVVKFGHTWQVYKGRPVSNQSPTDVVVKLLTPKAEESGLENEVWEETLRTYRELKHPGILGLLHSGHEYGRYFLVQPYSKAHLLRDLWKHNPLPVARVVHVMVQLFDIVTTLHSRGILHGGLSIDRVRILGDDRVELWDLGVRRTRDRSSIGLNTMLEGLSSLAPDAEPSEARDQFLLGRVAWELLAGRSLVGGRNPVAAVQQIRSTPAPRLADLRSDIPAALSNVAARMLDLQPWRRYPSVQEAWDAWQGAGASHSG